MYKTLALAAFTAVLLAGCARAPSNVQTLVSENCGADWTLIPVGGIVPAGVGNTCFMTVEVPNYPMVGESVFRGTFDNRVRVNVVSSYDYTITDALAFIRNARFIGRNASANAGLWDTAESILVDRLLREVANSDEFLLAEDVVDFNQGDFEDRLMLEMNERLRERGITLNTFTFVVTPDDQTSNMIDIAAALRVCNTIEAITQETCEAIMTARAGAARVTVGATQE